MRVLLVEDDELLGRALKTGLEQAGYTPEWVRDGETALEVLQANLFSAVALDISLPRMSGLEVLKSLRQNASPTAALPVVIMTAYGTVESAVDAMKAGASDYVLKPFSLA